MDPRNPVVPQAPMYDQPSTSQQLPYPPPPPMQPYQQHPTHSRNPYPASQQFGPSTPSNRMSNVQSWQQNHFDSGFHSMSASQNPSVMSYAESQMSLQSMSSTVSEVPPVHLTQLNEQAQARINRITTFFKGGDPAKAKQAIPKLIAMLDDADEDVVSYSVAMLKDVIRSDCWRPQNASPVVDDLKVAHAVKDVMCRFRNNKWIIRCCFTIYFFLPPDYLFEVLQDHKEEVLDILTNGITISEHSINNYAIMVLNSLMAKEKGKAVVQYLREQKTIVFIAEWLGNATLKDKMLSIVVDTIMKICQKNEEQRSFFVVNLSGIQKLVQILATRVYKPLISNVVKLLHSIASADTSQTFYSKRIVDARIFDYVPKHLAISDDSNLPFILKLLWSLSDITSNSDLKPLLDQLVQKISHPNLLVKQMCVDSISNFIANKSDLKLFIVQRNVVVILIQLLEQTDMPFNNDKRIVEKVQVRLIEKIQEAALTVLSHLCSSHLEARGIVAYLPQTPLRFILLKKLIEKRPAILKQTLSLILKLCSIPQNMSILKTTVLTFDGEYWYIPAICSILAISVEQIGTEIEGVRIFTLAKLSLEILANFCIDRSVAEIVFKIFTENSGVGHAILPAVLLTKEGADYLKVIKVSSLKLLIELANCGAAARYISGNDLVLESLGHAKNSEVPELVVLADQVLEKATATCRNPPPPSYRTDQIAPPQAPFHHQQNNPQYYEMYPEPPPPYAPSSYPPHQSLPPIYPPNGGEPYPYPTGHPGYSQPSGYQSPSNYENQPMSIGAPQAPTMISANDGPKHEELAYIHPMEEPMHIYPSAQSASMPVDQDYATMAPQPSPFQMGQAMQWNWEGE